MPGKYGDFQFGKALIPGGRGDEALRAVARRAGFLDVFRDGLGVVRRTTLGALEALVKCIGKEGNAKNGVAVVINGSRRVVVERGFEEGVELVLEDGARYLLRAKDFYRGSRGTEVRLPVDLPVGVHQLRWGDGVTHVMARPAKLETGPARRLAVFMPLHAMASRRSMGIGDLTDLGNLTRWSRDNGAAYVGTLPLFPVFLDKPFDPSPYRPVSRLFWNEIFIDPMATGEFAHPAARAVAASVDWRRDLRRAREGKLVDYRLAMGVKRRILTVMSRVAFEDEQRRRAIKTWARGMPDAEQYADFRASFEREDREGARRYYLYAQFLLREQMRGIVERCRGVSPLYLDLPVGVHPEGFDVWCRPGLFLRGASVGAPPDALQERGQVWGLPPMHPTAGRADGYGHFRQVLRNMLSVAGMIRIDHVMGLHRIYCVPEGGDGRDGAYLRHPKEELYAALMIESYRAGAVVVGENLGTVPAEVNREMEKRGIVGMHVRQFTFKAGRRAIGRAGRHELDSLNTHDTPTFAGFWKGLDIENAKKGRREREDLRRAIKAELRRLKMPSRTVGQVCRSMMLLQAAGLGRVALVNLEDLWLEERRQNLPGVESHPNWRQRAAMTLERIASSRSLRIFLNRLASLRKKGR